MICIEYTEWPRCNRTRKLGRWSLISSLLHEIPKRSISGFGYIWATLYCHWLNMKQTYWNCKVLTTFDYMYFCGKTWQINMMTCYCKTLTWHKKVQNFSECTGYNTCTFKLHCRAMLIYPLSALLSLEQAQPQSNDERRKTIRWNEQFLVQESAITYIEYESM